MQHLRYWIIDHNTDAVCTKEGVPLVHVYSSWNALSDATTAARDMNRVKKRSVVKTFDSDRINQRTAT